jgi:ADP-ribose pyrophosphatase
MLPDNAKSIFKGEIFEIFQWEQKMYDDSIEIFEKVSRPDTVEIIAITSDGKIIIQNQEQPDSTKRFLSVVGGRVDKGEKPFDAAKREMLEETGYSSDVWMDYSKETPSKKMIWDIYVYIAKNCIKTNDQKLDPGEKIDLIFVDMDEFLRLVDTGELRGLSTELKLRCVRAIYDPGLREQLKNDFFGG